MKIHIMGGKIPENLGFKSPLRKVKIVLFFFLFIFKFFRCAVFYGEFENEQKKDKKKFDLPERGFEPQIFSNFPAHDLNSHGR